MKLATFDIFDTTLLRRQGTPSAVWQDMATRLYPDAPDLQDAFIAWRSAAAGETLRDIYQNIDPSFLRFAQKDREGMMQEEMAEEEASLVPNPPVVRLIEQRRQEGFAVAFVSDMYLSSQFLRKVLEVNGCLLPSDRVYVSCEHHARKDTGALYDAVRRELRPKEWVHYGDNRRSDVKMARRKGIRAIHTDTAPNNAERDYALLNPRFAATSRLCRLQQAPDKYAAFAADFVIPAYLPYALYVLREARRMGIRRLYFLSRDSYILLTAAKALQEEAQGIELHYLFVSRRSLLLPYLCGEAEQAYLAATDRNTIVRTADIDKLLRTLGTSREELRDTFNIEFPYSKANSLREQEDFLNKIFHSDFTPVLQTKAREQLDLLLDYFKAEGLMDGATCAAVDVGWLGTSRLMINYILRREGAGDLHFFYYGVRRDVFPPSAGRYSAYFQAGELSTDMTALLEHYYSASPYPSTVGYRKDDSGCVAPVFASGQSFCHTPITQAHQTVMVTMATAIQPLCRTHYRQMRDWAVRSFEILGNPKKKTDVNPLASQCAFDDKQPFVKRLSLCQLFRMTLLGEQITGYDWGSLRLTVPRCLLAPIWQLSRKTQALRCRIYRKLLANK